MISNYYIVYFYFVSCSGLGTQLVRQIPNTAIMMATYEAVVYVLSNQMNPSSLIVGNWERDTGQSVDSRYIGGKASHRFPALAALLFNEQTGEACGDVTVEELESAFVVHCICDFFIDL